MQIWHNPRCTKSRQALSLLEDAGVTPTIRLYLEEPPTVDELTAVLGRLGLEPWELTRMKEPVAAELALRDWGREAGDRDRWIAAMVENPKLIERPLVLADDGRAVVGRPTENVKALL